MQEKEVLKILSEANAVITGSHIVYTSGRHGSSYINKDAIYPLTEETSRLCRALAEHFAPKGIEVVIAPVVGGVILSQWTAHHLTEMTGRPVLVVYAEKTEGDGFVIKRGYDKRIHRKKVLVVEDVLNTGGSVQKVVEVTRRAGGNVIGVGALCNRGGVTSKEVGDVPELFSLVNIPLESWDPKECPLCTKEIPINTEVGKGREFLNQRQK